MKAETILELLFSGDYDNLSVKEFAHIVNRETGYTVPSEAEVEDEKYAKQVERAKEIHENYTPREDKYYETV